MYFLLLVIQAVSIIFLFIESGYIFAKMGTGIHKFLFLNCISTLANNIGYLLMMLSTSEEQCLTAIQMSYFGKVWIPFSLFIFCMAMCGIRIKKPVMLGMILFQAFIFFLVLTCRWHTLYYTSIEYVVEGNWRYIKHGNGIWHHIYSIALILLILIGLFNLFRGIRREKNYISKKRMVFVTLAVMSTCAGFIINLTGVTGGYDCTVLGYTVGTIFMYVAIFKYNLLDTLQMAKDYVVDEISEAVMVVDQNEKLEYYNKPAAEILSSQELEPNSWIQEIDKAVQEGNPIEMHEKIYSPQKKDLYEDNEPCGRVYVLVDDTEHYNYMKDLKEQKEIAEEANESKSAFLSVVSHEIRTPMNAVVGMTELLLRDKGSLNEKQEKYLKNIKNSGSALVMIVNDILDQSKIEAGKMEIIEQPYELRPMAEDVKMIIENRIGSKQVHLMYEIDDNVPEFLVGDSLRIRQILINLMNNAVKFTEEGYIRLKVEVIEEDSERKLIRFSVKDSGQGIRAEDLSRLGQAFTQVDTRKNHSKEGTGLGLSISRDFIAMMGGQLEVASEYGNGSEFYFSIWQEVADVADAANVSEGAKQALNEGKFVAPEAKVLIVDDTEINLMIMEELLKSLDIIAETADSGGRALEMIQQNTYNVIFMDYIMPYMNGVETTEKIRGLALEAANSGDEEKSEYYKTLPIIALSGDTSDEARDKFMRAGIDDFTEKPVDMKRLRKLLYKWLPADLVLTPDEAAENS